MAYTKLVYKKSGRIGSITLNRPEADNAIDAGLAVELSNVCSSIAQDRKISVVTITGAGKTFSTGTDLNSYAPAASRLSVAESVARLDCPVIAAINGDALGQGLELALVCDLRIAAETARLGLPQVARGFIPADGGTQRLPRLVGRARALEMLLLGESINAAEAYRIGLVNSVVSLETLPLAVAELAQKIASFAPLALRYAKEAVTQGMELTLTQGLRLESDLYSLLQTTHDRTEGIIAFRQKRKPAFKGE